MEYIIKKTCFNPSNIITNITKDEYHRIWIGTTRGIVSYNGFEWKRYCKQKKTLFSIFMLIKKIINGLVQNIFLL